jgi:cytochrome c-type biogenesis protein CcmH
VIRILALLLFLAAPAHAVTSPDEMLADPTLEARARSLSQELRCLVCQNQSIDDSDADLARDLRRIVRERLVAGDSDEAIRDYLVNRYGEFVLLRPPVQPATWLLWFGPVVVLVLGVVAIGVFYRGRRHREPSPAATLSQEERDQLDRVLAEVEGQPR